ncbi:MAG: hypothetical protein ABR529_05285 [Actinomycetota bacterium]
MSVWREELRVEYANSAALINSRPFEFELNKGVRARSNGSRRRANATLEQYLVETWLPEIETQVKPTTLESTRTIVLRHIVPAIGRLPPTNSDVRISSRCTASCCTSPRHGATTRLARRPSSVSTRPCTGRSKTSSPWAASSTTRRTTSGRNDESPSAMRSYLERDGAPPVYLIRPERPLVPVVETARVDRHAPRRSPGPQMV